MPGIDGTAVNVALPIVQRDLHAGSGAIQWVVEGYALFLSALILAGGSLGDRLGRRRMFAWGVAMFAAASAGCAASHTVAELIAARCVQGMGGALLVPESLALISASFEERERGAAIGTWSGFLAAAMAVGPLLGGWLVETFSWRLVFVINLPIAVAILLLTFRFVPESRDEEGGPQIDWMGAALATMSLALLTYGFITLQDPHSLAPGASAAAAGLLIFVVFAAVERRSTSPMIPLGIFSSRAFCVANVYTLMLYAVLGASLFFLPFDLINIRGYTPLAAGAALLPVILLMFASSRWSGSLVARVGARLPMTIGAIAAGAGFTMLGFAHVNGSYWTTVFPGIVMLGIGTSTFVAPLTTLVMNSAPIAHAGSASGINNAISRVAGLLAIAILGIVLVASTHHALSRAASELPAPVRHSLQTDSLLSGRAPDSRIAPAFRARAQNAVGAAYRSGFRDVMLICAMLSFVSAALAFALLPPKATANAGGV